MYKGLENRIVFSSILFGLKKRIVLSVLFGFERYEWENASGLCTTQSGGAVIYAHSTIVHV